jgi:hypothetical protein
MPEAHHFRESVPMGKTSALKTQLDAPKPSNFTGIGTEPIHRYVAMLNTHRNTALRISSVRLCS